MRPAAMCFDIINADADDTGVLGLERGLRLVEAGHFGRTDEGKVVRIKEQNDHLGADSAQAQMADPAVKGAGEIKRWSGIAWLEHCNRRSKCFEDCAQPTESRRS